MKKLIFLGILIVSITVFSRGDSGVYRDIMMETASEKVESYPKDPVKMKEIKVKKEKEVKVRKKKVENKDWEDFAIDMMMDKESSRN